MSWVVFPLSYIRNRGNMWHTLTLYLGFSLTQVKISSLNILFVGVIHHLYPHIKPNKVMGIVECIEKIWSPSVIINKTSKEFIYSGTLYLTSDFVGICLA